MLDKTIPWPWERLTELIEDYRGLEQKSGWYEFRDGSASQIEASCEHPAVEQGLMRLATRRRCSYAVACMAFLEFALEYPDAAFELVEPRQ